MKISEVLDSDFLTDILTGEKILRTPEEVVRQNYINTLINEYGYPSEHIDKEVPIQYGVSEIKDVETGNPKRADIVVYNSSNKDADEIYIIIECKKPDIKTGELQVKSYGNATTASILIWHNELDTKYWEKSNKRRERGYNEKIYLPRYGEYYGTKKIEKKDLKPSVDLQAKFKRIHNNIYANTSSSDKTRVFNQMLFLIFIKMYDEKLYDTQCKFFIDDKEYEDIKQKGISDTFKNRIFGMFDEVKNSPLYSDVFVAKDEIELSLEQVAFIVAELEYLDLLYTDVKGEAFQAFINSYFRGDAGQFFTPDPIKKLMVEIIKPEPTRDVVFDPTCGSGGFLVSTINYFKDFIKKKLAYLDESGNVIPDNLLTLEQKRSIAGQIKELAGKNILGTDFDNVLTRIAKMYMIMMDDGHSGIYTVNSLKPLEVIKKETGVIKEECCTVILANPPFGSKGKVTKKEILQNFDLGYKWQKKDGKYKVCEKINDNLLINSGQVPDILFIERCYEFLRYGGRMAIIIPDGDLSNQTTEYVRQWIIDHFIVAGVISLPSMTFLPFGAGVTASILICIKPKKDRAIPEKYPVFFGKLDKIGYNVSGKTIYKTDNMGNILDEENNPIPIVKGTFNTSIAQIDSDIPQLLKEWDDFYTKHKSFLW